MIKQPRRSWSVPRLMGVMPVIVCMLALLVGAARGQHERDPRREPRVREPRPRLAVLSPALAVIVRDLGLGNWMVGRHGYDIWSPQTLPVVGDQAGLDYEALIKVSPQYVLTEWGTRPIPERLQSLAAQYQWTVSNYSTLSLEDIRQSAKGLAALDPDQPAWDAHPLKKEMERAWSKREQDFARAGRVLLIMSAEPSTAVLGPGSAHYEILKLIGGTPAPDKGSPFIEMDVEDVLHLAPESIVLIKPRAPDDPKNKDVDRSPPKAPRTLTPEEVEKMLGPLAKLDIPAVKQGRVGLIDDPLALLPSTSLIRFADDLAKLLSEWTTGK